METLEKASTYMATSGKSKDSGPKPRLKFGSLFSFPPCGWILPPFFHGMNCRWPIFLFLCHKQMQVIKTDMRIHFESAEVSHSEQFLPNLKKCLHAPWGEMRKQITPLLPSFSRFLLGLRKKQVFFLWRKSALWFKQTYQCWTCCGAVIWLCCCLS